MFERPDRDSRAVLVSLDLGAPNHAESTEELRQLAATAGIAVAAVVGGRRQRPDPQYFAGSGKADELAALMAEQGARLAIFNHELTPAQQRNLERKLGCRVMDRVELILLIFSQRARSHEGKLQVELAQLQHMATRLVRGWTHLERQKGGIGVRGGPGETQLEVDRRLLAKRTKSVKDELRGLASRRGVQRRARQRAQVMSVSLVGYTNAGKSTLFNRLTRAGVYAANQLFATLDTTTRRLHVPGAGKDVVLSDTVGFIRDLPHSLVAAFRATLEEAVQADVLLHVVDAASATRDEQIAAVNEVLAEIGADHIPQILVYNKIDLAGLEPRAERDEYAKIRGVWLSAAEGSGTEGVLEALRECAIAHPAWGAPNDGDGARPADHHSFIS